jgi:hypothetical protein
MGSSFGGEYYPDPYESVRNTRNDPARGMAQVGKSFAPGEEDALAAWHTATKCIEGDGRRRRGRHAR